jgi:hypothetical protein
MSEQLKPFTDPPADAPPGANDRDRDHGNSHEEAEVHPVERPHLPTGKVPLGRLALEALMIAFGVLLALSLESWQEHRKEQALAREALANIRVETARVAERVRAQLPKQQEVAASLQAFRDDLAAGKRPPTPEPVLYPPGLSTAAWSTAMSTQALAHMDFQTVQALATFYETQRWLDRLEDAWMRLITEPHGSTPEADRQWAGAAVYTLRSYIEIENSLLNRAEELRSLLPEK